MALDMEKINKLPQNQKVALLAGIAVVLILVYWFTVFTGKREELGASNDQLAQLQVQLAENRTLAADLPRFKEELTRLDNELTEALRQLPNDKELPVLLTDITTLGKNAGLEFKSFIPQPEVKKGFYAEVPINIALNGGFHELAKFFDELSRLDRIVNVQNFSVDNVQVRPNSIELQISGVATTFRFVSDE
ncbi:MAG: type 4a pilus biogenesis protein PilO, partial [Myxococcota bacterium]